MLENTGEHMSKINNWDVSDKFWSKVEPLIPTLEVRNAEK